MRFVGVERAAVELAQAIFAPTTGPKRCPRCERNLPLEAFQGDRTKRDGLSSICADCVSVAGKRYWATLHESKRRVKLLRGGTATPQNKRLRSREKIVRRALARGAARLLATGHTVDGRRAGWTRPDRRKPAEEMGT